MPGVIQPPHQQFMASLTQLDQRIRALETQQQTTISNATGQAVLNIGLIPGSNPARYGLEFVNPSTGAEIMFMGEDAMGNISLIGNNALTNPVSPIAVHADAQSFALTPTLTVVASATVTVPSGFSQALVMASAQASARNSTSAQDALQVGVSINGGATAGFTALIDALATASIHPVVSASSSSGTLLTSLGSSFTLNTSVSSTVANWASDPYNTANIDAAVLFLR